MSNVVLDFAVSFNQIDSFPKPSLGFLHKIGVICKIAGGVELVKEVYNLDELKESAPNEFDEISALFDAGLNSVFIISVSKVEDAKKLIEDRESDFYTIHNSSSFETEGFLSAVEAWKGVKGFSDIDVEMCKSNSMTKNTSAMYVDVSEKDAYKSLYSFASLLSKSLWKNQQYIQMPKVDGAVTSIGMANNLFDSRVGVWLADESSGTRLAFFVAGGLSITVPYIMKETEYLIQSEMISFLAVNEPFNVALEIAELERQGQKVIDNQIELGYFDPSQTNKIKITKSNEAFIVNGAMTVAPSEALWRVKIDAYQTQG